MFNENYKKALDIIQSEINDRFDEVKNYESLMRESHVIDLVKRIMKNKLERLKLNLFVLLKC